MKARLALTALVGGVLAILFAAGSARAVDPDPAIKKIFDTMMDAVKSGDRDAFVKDVEMALYASKIISYAQGFALLNAMAKESGWTINNGAVALMWRGGCIIRSVFLGDIKRAFDKNPKLENLLMDEFFSSALNKYQASWRKAIIHAIEIGVPMPAFSTAFTHMLKPMTWASIGSLVVRFGFLVNAFHFAMKSLLVGVSTDSK